MKSFFLILLSVLLVFSCVAVSADEPCDGTTEHSTEMIEAPEASDQSANVIRFILIGGSVIGALCAITLLYKKKDEIRYL